MQLYPKMDFRLEQHFFRATSKAENFGLFALYPCYFLSAFWLPRGQRLTIKEETGSPTRCLSLHLGYQFLAQRWLGGVGSLHLTDCLVGFDHNAITHLATYSKLQKIPSPDLHPVFLKYGNVPHTQNSYTLTLCSDWNKRPVIGENRWEN